MPITHTDLTDGEWAPGTVTSVELDRDGHPVAVVRLVNPARDMRIPCDPARVPLPDAEVAVVCVPLEGAPIVRVRTEVPAPPP